ncbi:DUF6479 family protein [Streptomyces sp. NPDC051940]|uniref:DUF6479 family protein n=1 Tax=Streptomyces sp. NPDC051940 TaxID=3155675 RepID=UPI00343C4A34
MNLALNDLLVGIGPFVMGLIVVGMLIGAVWLGMRIRDNEPPPPTPEEQPKLPESGPVVEELEMREDIEQTELRDRRRTPYEAQSPLTRRKKDQRPGRWDAGRSGSYGGGVG